MKHVQSETLLQHVHTHNTQWTLVTVVNVETQKINGNLHNQGNHGNISNKSGHRLSFCLKFFTLSDVNKNVNVLHSFSVYTHYKYPQKFAWCDLHFSAQKDNQTWQNSDFCSYFVGVPKMSLLNNGYQG
jgi:hypothetical protein